MYPDWYFLNIAKRQGRNGTESIGMLAPLSLVNGIFLPYPTMALLFTYATGRYYYAQGYTEKEGVNNKQRVAGAVMCHTTTFVSMFMSLFIGI